MNKSEVINSFDLIITSNPNIIIDYSNKINIIKFITNYNKQTPSNIEISSINDLDGVIKNLINDRAIQ